MMARSNEKIYISSSSQATGMTEKNMIFVSIVHSFINESGAKFL